MNSWNQFTNILEGHTSAVYSVAFSPDGTQLTLALEDCTIQLWDAVSGAAVGEPLKGHTDHVLSVAFSPDGTRLALASEDRTIQLWDTVSGAAVGEPLKGH